MRKIIFLFAVFLVFIASSTSAMNKSSSRSVTDVAFICGQSSHQTSMQAVIMKNAMQQVSSSVAITTMPTRDQAVYSTGNISFANSSTGDTRSDSQFTNGPTTVLKKPIFVSILTNSLYWALNRTHTMSAKTATGGAHIVIWPGASTLIAKYTSAGRC